MLKAIIAWASELVVDHVEKPLMYNKWKDWAIQKLKCPHGSPYIMASGFLNSGIVNICFVCH